MSGRACGTSLLLATTLVVASPLSAQDAGGLARSGLVPGAIVRVNLLNGAIVQGRVVALLDSMLVVVSSGPASASPDSVRMACVTRLQVRRASRFVAGAVAGAAVGAGAGYVWWSSVDTDAPLLPGLATLAVAGAGLGLGVAALLPRWRDVPLTNARAERQGRGGATAAAPWVAAAPASAPAARAPGGSAPAGRCACCRRPRARHRRAASPAAPRRRPR